MNTGRCLHTVFFLAVHVTLATLLLYFVFFVPTVDRVLRARSKMKKKANGPADCLVAEMLQCLPTERAYEVACWFDKRFRGECRWNILRLVFLKNTDARLENILRGFRAIAYLSVFLRWHTTVLVDLLHGEKEPVEWRSSHVGAERGVNCEHMQDLEKYLSETLGTAGRSPYRSADTIRLLWRTCT